MNMAAAAYANSEAVKQGLEPGVPLEIDPIKTNSLQSYLEDELINRLGL